MVWLATMYKYSPPVQAALESGGRQPRIRHDARDPLLLAPQIWCSIFWDGRWPAVRAATADTLWRRDVQIAAIAATTGRGTRKQWWETGNRKVPVALIKQSRPGSKMKEEPDTRRDDTILLISRHSRHNRDLRPSAAQSIRKV